MKIEIFLILISVLVLISSKSFAGGVWTDGDPYGPGKEVILVYPQFLENKVIFKTSDNKFYSYGWGSTGKKGTDLFLRKNK